LYKAALRIARLGVGLHTSAYVSSAKKIYIPLYAPLVGVAAWKRVTRVHSTETQTNSLRYPHVRPSATSVCGLRCRELEWHW
jgi:hypothetical protein